MSNFPLEPEEGFKYPDWQKPYLDALIAPEAELREKVDSAENILRRRLGLLSVDEQHLAERRALEAALGSLRILRQVGASAG